MFRFFPWWKPNRTTPRSTKQKQRPYRRRLELEPLEDRVVPANFHVALTGSDLNAGGTADPYRTVQAAINAAAAVSDGNDIIKVEAGTYDTAAVDLGLSIPGSSNLQDLQLLGGYDVGSLFTTRTPRSTIYVPQTPGDRNIQDVNVADPNVTIDGFYFVFDGNGVGGTGGTRQSGGVLSNTTGFVFNDNTIEVGLGRTSGGARSLGVATTSTDQTGLMITNNLIQADGGTGAFNDFGHGIFLNPDPVRTTDALISGNTITGTTLANGIVVDTTGHVTITGNTILRTGTGDVFGLALIGLRARSVATALDDVTISENTLDSAGRANSIAIHFADAGGTQPISGVLVEKNLIQNNTTAILFGPGVAAQNNAISATINYNSFTGNTTALFRSTLGSGSTMIDATRNWWNHISGPTTAANPGGLGQTINDTTGITFAPWLVYSPDSNPGMPGVQLPTTVTITAGNDVSAAENDFTLLQNAVGAVADGQTLDLSGDFDWTATNAAAAYAASTNTSATADIRGVELPSGVNNVTITSSAENAHVLGGGDTDDLFNAFLFAEDGPSVGNTNFILEKLNIDDFENAVMFGWNGTGTFTGTKIRDNSITIGGDNGGLSDLQNIAIYFAAGTNQQITGNTVSFQGDGTRVVGSGARSFGFQNNTTGGALYDGLLIDDNTFQLAATSTGVEIAHGIWENGHNDDNSADISITNNRFLGRTGMDDFDRALFLTSQTDGLVIDGNMFTDVDNVLFSRNAAAGVEAGDEFTFTNNVLTRVGGADGIFLRNVTDDAIPVTVVVHWNINNTIDGFTGVRGLNELSTQATGASRPMTAASDINAVIGEGMKDPVFVDTDWAGAGEFTDPDGIGTGVGPVAFGFNGFATIQAGIDAADAGGTVNVGAGTYAENVLVNKSVSLLGPNADVNPNTGVRGPEAIVVPASTDTAAGNIFAVTASDVTIKGFTIDGNNPMLMGGVLLNGVDVDAANGVSNANTFIDGLRVENNIIQNLQLNGVLGDLSSVGGTPSGDNFIVNNQIDNLPSISPLRGRGALVAANFYAEISGNELTRVATGIQTNNFFLANPGGVASISNNDISYYARGIFHNLHYQDASTWTISDNDITAEAGATATNGGLFLSSIQSAVSAIVTGNDVTGAQTGIEIWNLPTTSTITVSGGTLTGNNIGILATNFNAFGAGMATTAIVSGVTVLNSTTAGIKVEDNPSGTATIAATIEEDTEVSGSPTGILVSGPDASATIQNNDDSISGNVIGIDIDGGSAAVTNNHIFNNSTGVRGTNAGILTAFASNNLDGGVDPDNGTDLRVDATAGTVTVGSNNAFAGDTFYIDNQSAQDILATGNSFDAATNFRIEDRMSHKVDNLAQGLVTWVADNVYVTTPGGGSTDSNIQRGIDAASAGFTVNVEAGTYVENVSINKDITLRGAQAGNDADTRFAAFLTGPDGPKADPTVETILTTPVNNPTAGNPGANDLIRALVDGITIDGLVLDGNNPNLNMGGDLIAPNGVHIHARRGIVNADTAGVFFDLDNLLVQNNIIQNVAQRGISLANDSTISTGNLITGNVITNFGADPVNGGLGIILFTNAYADITNNTIIDTQGGGFATGLQLQNFFGNGSMTWSGNTITVAQDDVGIIANLFYAPNATLNINNNTINAAAGVLPTVNDFTWGIYVLSVQVGSTVSVSDNTVGSSGGQFDRGIYLWNLPTANTVTVSGGSVANSVVGIQASNLDPFFSDAAATQVILSNVTVTGATTGILVEDASTATISATINNDSTISGSQTGILVQGADASANITGNDDTITGNVVGIDVDGGSASVTANTITANGTGIHVFNGGVLTSVANNFITNQTQALGTGQGIRIDGTAGTIGAIFNNDFSGNEILALNTAAAVPTVDASGNWWGTNAGGINGVAAQVAADVDYTPWLHIGTDTDPAAGFQGDFSYLHVDDDSPQVVGGDRINEAVGLLANGSLVGGARIIDVEAGTYAENVLVNKSVSLLGPNAGIDPNTDTRGAEAIVVPAVVAIEPNTSGTIFRVGTNSGHIDVTIDGLLIDGHNDSLTGGRMLNGVEVHTGAGIISSTGSFDDETSGFDVTLTVHNNIIQNLERYGVYISGVNSGAMVLAGNDVSFNKIDNLPSGNNFGGGHGRATAFGFDVYGKFTHNVVTRVNVGWQDDNHFQASTGDGTLVDSNEIHTYHRGIFHNLQYGTATAATISNNDIFVETSGDFGASDTNFGIELSSIQSAVSATVMDNDVTGTVHGILLWNLSTTGAITVSGGTLLNNTFGILATNNDPQFGAVSTSTSAVISGVTITGATTAGIFVEDSAFATGTVALTVENDTSVSGSPTGILVNGSNASATIRNNDETISGNAVGISVLGGSAAVDNNRITMNTTGVSVDADGTLTSVTQNFINANTGFGITIGTGTGAGSVAPIFNNDLSGNGGFGITNTTSQLLNASGNWWGSSMVAGVLAEIDGLVDYSPWLESGTDTSTDPGFQGDFSSLTVNADSLQAASTGNIQEGIDLVTAGGTVHVLAGTYAESVAANKAGLVLKGATGSAANVVIDSTTGDGITVSANSVTIRDLRITGAVTGLVASNVTPLTLRNLLIDGNTTGGSLTNVASVDFTASASADTITVDGDDFSASGVQSLGYTGVSTLMLHGNAGDDTFNVTPAASTTITIDGDAPIPMATPGDTLNVNTAGTMNSFLSYTSEPDGFMGSYTFDDRGTVFFQEIETLDVPMVSKMESIDPVIAGSGVGNLTYIITVTNNGPSDASGVMLSEDLTLPAGVSVVSITPSSGNFVTTTAPDGTWNLGNLVSGASATLTVVLTVGASAASGAVISNTATVTAFDQTRINPGDDSATQTTTVQQRSIDLKVNKRRSTSAINVGKTVNFKIILTNFSTITTTNVQVTDLLPPGLRFVSATPTLGTYNPTTGVWNVAALAPGAKAFLKIVAQANGSVLGQVSNTAQLTGSDQVDITPFNNARTRRVHIVDVFRR